MKKNRGTSPISTSPISSTLESFSRLEEIGKYLVKTIDGIFALILSIGYLSWALALSTGLLGVSGQASWNFILGLFFMPVLFIIVFLWHRIGKSVLDKGSIIFCIISNTALALAPIYNYFWR
jgi:hypothetical protein